jgi:hypothetical protein
MNLTYTCPQCDSESRVELNSQSESIECSQCGANLVIPPGAFDGDRICRCLVCPSTDLFLRKDFPQRLGVGIVVIGFVASSIAWAYMMPLWTFAILFATALIDVVLYAVVPNALMCYRCGAQYRDISEIDEYEAFNLETHERYRQQAARLKQSQLGS